MSLTVLGNETLEALICSKCKRYLSAKPITMDGNRNILCGRCSTSIAIEHSTLSRLSYLNKISDYILFKCINRYDGCAEVLTVHQTILHEKNCKSQKYICPFCINDSSAIPSYEFVSHVKAEHEKSFLLNNMFTVELIDSEKHEFFYKKGDYLFFIHQWFKEDENCLFLNATFLGGNKNNFSQVNQKYYILDSSTLSKVNNQKCFHIADLHNKSSMQMVKIEMQKKNLQFLTIIFEFDIPSSEHFVIKVDGNSTQNLMNEDIRYDYENLLKKSVKRSMKMCASSQCEYARTLAIVHTDGEDTNLSLNSTKTKIHIEVLDENSECQIKSFCYHCILCKCVYDDFYYIETANAMQYFVCAFCEPIMSPYFDVKGTSFFLPKKHLKSIKYTCIRKCKNKEIIDVYHSENSCSLFKRIACKSCCFSTEDFATLQKHFLTVHNSQLLSFSPLIYFVKFTKNNCSKSTHIFCWDILIVLKLEKVNNEYWLSAEICKKDSTKDLHLLIEITRIGEYIGNIFYSRVKVDLNTCYDIKPIILEI